MTELPARAVDLCLAVASGEADPAQVLRSQRQRAAVLDAAFHCVARWHDADGTPPAGPLAGLGLAHKDVFATGDGAMCAGRPQPLDRPQAPSPALQRLRAAGGVNLAALVMAELGCGATGDNPWAPRPVNPCDARAVVGGSSSGSAVAVASSLAYASLGTDTAGSIRIPAATCGLVGLKPTYGAITREGLQALAPSLDTVGVLARCAADAALVLANAADVPGRAGLPAQDAASLLAALSAPRRWHVRHHFPVPVMQGPCGPALAALLDADLYSDCEAVPLPDFAEWTRLARVMLHVEATDTHMALLRQAPDSIGPAARAVLLPGLGVPAIWYREAVAARPAMLAGFLSQALGDADLLLLPAMALGVPDWEAVTPGISRFDRAALDSLHAWMPYANYLGLPAVVFPVGRDAAGRPLCAQAVARPGGEATLLAFVHHWEHLHGVPPFSLPTPSLA
ncbi:MAG: amidase [Pigmentiphaga sp.]|uniref:amidase n=1 Tax=Pigmentiphaga sp. TaxID=1977564 RepID=UPI0029AB21BE|nr:amidase [Pigmentiphaga sp.]MDX3905954.1 amidase [Pigmentiphaga sp.]